MPPRRNSKPEVKKSTIAEAGIAAAVVALTRAYAGYFVPLHFSEETFARYIRANDIDPAASPVWFHDGEPVAIGVAGIRANRGWVGAFGLSPAFRGKGLAQAMFAGVLRHIKGRGVLNITLEVLDRNLPAIAVYERAGFRTVRKLFTLHSPEMKADPAGAQTVDPAVAIRLADGTGLEPCWQREDRSLELRLAALRALRCGSSFALFRAQSGDVSVLKAHLDIGDTDALMAAVAAHSADGTIAIVNEPAGSPLPALLTTRGWNTVHVQHEMHRSA